MTTFHAQVEYCNDEVKLVARQPLKFCLSKYSIQNLNLSRTFLQETSFQFSQHSLTPETHFPVSTTQSVNTYKEILTSLLLASVSCNSWDLEVKNLNFSRKHEVIFTSIGRFIIEKGIVLRLVTSD